MPQAPAPDPSLSLNSSAEAKHTNKVTKNNNQKKSCFKCYGLESEKHKWIVNAFYRNLKLAETPQNFLDYPAKFED